MSIQLSYVDELLALRAAVKQLNKENAELKDTVRRQKEAIDMWEAENYNRQMGEDT